MTERLTIGMGQLLVEGGEPERNLTRAEEMIEEAREKGCQWVLLSRLGLVPGTTCDKYFNCGC